MRWFTCAILGLLLIGGVQAQEKPTLAEQGWVDDPKLLKSKPANHVLVTEKALAALWKDWGIKNAMPKIDFTKEFVIVATDKGVGNFLAVLDKKGNVNFEYAGPPRDKPGFSFILQSHTRTGVKTVKGQPLPK